MEGRPLPGAAGGNQRVPVQEFAARFQSKKECYNFLTQDCEAYEPPQDTVTVWHLRDQIRGTKGYIKGSAIKHLAVPHYDNLTLKLIMEWATANYAAVVERFFPQARELEKFPRQVSPLSLLLLPGPGSLDEILLDKGVDLRDQALLTLLLNEP